MNITTPADKLTNLKVGDRITVNSFGHTYGARVQEIKGNRARLVWVNKSGNQYDNWLTIPGRSEKDRNPTAAATRKLRVKATTVENHAKRALENGAAFEVVIARLQALVGTQPLRTEDNAYGTRLYYYGTGNQDYVWGGYTVEGAKRYGVTAKPIGLTWEQALANAITQAQTHRQERLDTARDLLAQASALRAEADTLKAS